MVTRRLAVILALIASLLITPANAATTATFMVCEIKAYGADIQAWVTYDTTTLIAQTVTIDSTATLARFVFTINGTTLASGVTAGTTVYNVASRNQTINVTLACGV